MGFYDRLSFKKRVVIAFALVPWLSVVFVFPFFTLFGNVANFSTWRMVESFLAFSIFLTFVTYFLEFFILIPIWFSFLRRGKISLSRFIITGSAIALAASSVAILLLLGFEGLWHLSKVIFLCTVIGCAEATVFWWIVRPDRSAKSRPNDSSGM